MNVHVVLKSYRATRFCEAHSVVLEVFDSYSKAFDFGEMYVEKHKGFDTLYDIEIYARDVK